MNKIKKFTKIILALLLITSLAQNVRAAINDWTNLAVFPVTPVGNGVCIVGVRGNDFIYALNGGNSTGFYRYNIGNNAWDTLQPISNVANKSAGLAWNGGDNVWAIPSNVNNVIYCYSISGNAWTVSTSSSTGGVGTNRGKGMAWGSGENLYTIPGNAAGINIIQRWNTGNNVWVPLASIPGTANQGGGNLVWGGSNNYYFMKGNANGIVPGEFARFNDSTNAWTALATASNTGLSYVGLAWDGGDYIYCIPGGNATAASTNFYKYNVANNTWITGLNAVPFSLDLANNLNAPSGRLTAGGTDNSNSFIYCLRGITGTQFAKYQSSAAAVSNQAPDPPSALAQYTSAWGAWATGDWKNYQQIITTFTLSDPDAGNTLQFDIQFSTYSDFSYLYVNSTNPATATLANNQATNYMTAILPEGTWYWRVNCTDNSGLSSAYSSFTVVNNRHFGIDLSSPTGYGIASVSDYTSSFTVTISAAADLFSGLNATPYSIKYSTDSNFAVSVTTTSDWFSETSTLTFAGLDLTATYYFQARARDVVLNISSWSATYTKSPNQKPNPPSGLTQYTIAWGAWATGDWKNYSQIITTFTLSDPDAANTLLFNIQFSTYSNFSYLYMNSTNPATAALTNNQATNYMTAILPEGTWYWRVNCADNRGFLSAYSSFTVVNNRHFGIDLSSPTGAGVDSIISFTSSFTVTVSAAVDTFSGLNATPYSIVYSTVTNFLVSITTASGWFSGTSTQTFNGLIPNTTYYFKSRARDSVLNVSDYSVTTVSQVNAPIPSWGNVYATSVCVTWTNPEPANPDKTRYIVQFSSTNFAAGTNIFSSTTVCELLSSTMTGLSINTTYWARVSAWNWNNIASTTTLTPAWRTTLYNSPSPSWATIWITSMSINWTNPAPADPNKTKYIVELSTASNFTGTNVTSTTVCEMLASTITALSPDTTYYARIVTDANYENVRTTATLSPLWHATLCNRPAPSWAAVWITSMSVNWTNSSGDPSNESYNVELSSTNFAAGTDIISSATVCGILTSTVTGLSANTTYWARVSARNWDIAGSTTTLSPLLHSTLSNPPAPYWLTLYITSITIAWTNLSPVNPSKTKYIVELSTASNFTGTNITSTTVCEMMYSTLYGLSMNTSYWARVSAQNWENAGSTIALSPAWHATLYYPPVPTWATVWITSVSINWTNPAPVNPDDARYNVELSSTNFAAGTNIFSSVTVCEVLTSTISGLTQNTVYYGRVAAWNWENAGSTTTLSPASQQTLSTVDLSSPGAVTNLTASSTTTMGRITLNWSAPGDDAYTGTIANGQYRIDYSTYVKGWNYSTWKASDTITNVAPYTPMSYNIDNLINLGTYYFRIWTADEVPNWSLESVPGTTGYPKLPIIIKPSGKKSGPNYSTELITEVQTDNAVDASPPSTPVASDGFFTLPGLAGDTLYIDSFSIVGIDTSEIITSCIMEAQDSWYAYLSYGSTDPVRFSTNEGATFSATTILPVLGDVGVIRTYDLYAQGVTTWDKIKFLDVTYNNTDNYATSPVVSFDYIWLRVETASGDTTPPAAVANLSAARGIQEGELKLTWTSPGDDGNSGTITGGMYRIRYSTYALTDAQWDPGSGWTDYQNKYEITWTTTTPAGVAQIRTITGLSRNTSYYVRLWTQDGIGNWSGISNGATSWAASPTPFPPSGLAQYTNLWQSWATGDWKNYRQIITTFTLSDPDAGNTLQFDIQFSTYSDFSYLYVNSTNPATATLTNNQATNYITAILPDGTWYWRVNCTDNTGLSSAYSSFTVVNNKHFGVDASSPSGYGFTLITNHISSFTVTVSAAVDAFSGLNATPYSIQYSTDSNFAVSVTTTSDWFSGTSTQTFGGLDAGATYYFQTRARDAVLNISSWSATYTKGENQPPNPPSSLSQQDGFGNTVSANTRISTTTPRLLFTITDPDVGQQVKYHIQISSKEGYFTAPYLVVDTTQPTAGLLSQSATWYDCSLTNSTSYWWRVKCIDSKDAGSAYSSMTITAGQMHFGIDTASPAAITDLTALAGTNDGEAKLSWTAPGDDGNARSLNTGSMFRINYSTNTISNFDSVMPSSGTIYISTAVSPGSLQAYTITGLNPGTTYYFAIKTRDSAGNWSSAGVRLGTAPAQDLMPNAVTYLTGIALDAKINLSWTTPSAPVNVNDLDKFWVYRSSVGGFTQPYGNYSIVVATITYTLTSPTTHQDTLNIVNSVTYYYHISTWDKGDSGGGLFSVAKESFSAVGISTCPIATVVVPGTVVLSGHIYSSKTNLGLENVLVVAAGTTTAVGYTDSSGYYSITITTGSPYIVLASSASMYFSTVSVAGASSLYEDRYEFSDLQQNYSGLDFYGDSTYGNLYYSTMTTSYFPIDNTTKKISMRFVAQYTQTYTEAYIHVSAIATAQTMTYELRQDDGKGYPGGTVLATATGSVGVARNWFAATGTWSLTAGNTYHLIISAPAVPSAVVNLRNNFPLQCRYYSTSEPNPMGNVLVYGFAGNYWQVTNREPLYAFTNTGAAAPSEGNCDAVLTNWSTFTVGYTIYGVNWTGQQFWVDESSIAAKELHFFMVKNGSPVDDCYYELRGPNNFTTIISSGLLITTANTPATPKWIIASQSIGCPPTLAPGNTYWAMLKSPGSASGNEYAFVLGSVDYGAPTGIINALTYRGLNSQFVRSVDSGATVDPTANISPSRDSFFRIRISTVINSGPKPITDLAANTPTDLEGAIRLVWTCNGVCGTYPLESGSLFSIQYSTSNTGIPPGAWDHTLAQINLTTGPVAVGTQETYNLTGLPEGATYYFRLWTRYGGGDYWSTISNLCTGYASVIIPASVTKLVAQEGDYGKSVKLSWIAPGDDGWLNNIIGGWFCIRWSTYSLTDTEWATPQASTYTPAGWADYKNKYSLGIATGTIARPVTPYYSLLYNVTSLTAGVTYYFRLWTRDENPSGWSGISNGATAFASISRIAVSLVTPNTYYNFGMCATNISTVSGRGIIVRNDDGTGTGSNVRETFELRIETTTPPSSTVWVASTTKGSDRFTLYGIFMSTTPLSAAFGTSAGNDIIISTDFITCSGNNFAINGVTPNGVGIEPFKIKPLLADTTLWFKLDTPLATSTSSQQTIPVIIRAKEED